MNYSKMTNQNLKPAFFKFLFLANIFLILTACISENRKENEINNPTDSTQTKTAETEETTNQDSLMLTDIDLSELDYKKLDSIKSVYQAKLDTGIDMLGTAREEYIYLVNLKDAYKNWLSANCSEGYNDYKIHIDKWEASIQTMMDQEENELRQKFGEEDWGRDMDMMIYAAGSRQLYIYIEDLIVTSKDWRM